jgi:hypothetical protein
MEEMVVYRLVLAERVGSVAELEATLVVLQQHQDSAWSKVVNPLRTVPVLSVEVHSRFQEDLVVGQRQVEEVAVDRWVVVEVPSMVLAMHQ